MICRVVRLISASRRSALTASSKPPMSASAERQRDAVERRAAQHLPDRRELADVAARRAAESRADGQQHRAHRRVAVGLHEVDPLAAGFVDARGPRGTTLPASAPADRVREQIERASFRCRAHALLDDVCEPADAAALVLLAQAVDLGLDDCVRLRVEVAERRPVDERRSARRPTARTAPCKPA